METLSCSFIIQTGFITLFLPHPTAPSISNSCTCAHTLAVHPILLSIIFPVRFMDGGGKFVCSCFDAQNKFFSCFLSRGKNGSRINFLYLRKICLFSFSSPAGASTLLVCSVHVCMSF